MRHSISRHSHRGPDARTGRTRIVSYNERLGPLLERQRELAAARNYWQQRWLEVNGKLESIPSQDTERRERVRQHRATIGGHLRDIKAATSGVKEELSLVRSRIKEAKG
jgi:hypothetical protein